MEFLQVTVLLQRNVPKTSARAHPYVFLSQDFGAILTETKAIIKAAISDNIWKLSAINAMLLVRWPTTSSTRKYEAVKPNIDSKRHFLPVYRPITLFLCWNDYLFLLGSMDYLNKFSNRLVRSPDCLSLIRG